MVDRAGVERSRDASGPCASLASDAPAAFGARARRTPRQASSSVAGFAIALVCGASACTPKKLVKATANYATMTSAAAAELGAAPGIVADLCLQRAQLEYLAVRPLPVPHPASSFADFYKVTPVPINLPGAATITWKQHCDGYRLADAAFAKALAAIAAYGDALGGFAGEDYDPGEDLEKIASGAAEGVAAISETAQPYKDALAGVGAPLGFVADVAIKRWKAKHLGRLVGKTDPAIQSVIAQLDEFLRIVRSRQLHDVREALHTLLEELDNIREATSPADPAGRVMVHKVDRITASLVDIEISGRIAQADRKLRALSEVLHGLAAAHGELRTGWTRGEDDAGAATLKRIGELVKAVSEDIQAFRDPAMEAP